MYGDLVMRVAISPVRISLALFFLCFVAAAQISFEESNWYKEIGRYDDYYSRFDLTRYTKADVEAAKSKYLKIASAKSNDEWTGAYRRETMLGSAEITWGGQNGFVYTYVYHTLANLDYGSVKAVGSSIAFVPERKLDGNRKRFFEGKHIQVKFGERHLLVPEDRMAEFAIWAVGREVPTGRRMKEIYTEEGFFWEKIDDNEKAIANVPTFPSAYAHLIRQSIPSKVLSVGRLRIKREKSADWGTTSEDHFRTLILSSGRRHGVKVGMRFWIDDLEEWVEIVYVSANRSRAELLRPFIKDREYCGKYENNGVTEFQCRDPKVRMAARTRPEYF